MVRRLVEQQQIRIAEERGGERHAHPPAAREGTHRRVLLVPAEAEAAEDGAGAGWRAFGADSAQALMDLGEADRVGVVPLGLGQEVRAFAVGGEDDGKGREVAAGRLLRDGTHTSASGEADVATIGEEIARDRAQQRRLAGAVTADEADPAAGIDAQVGVLQQRAAFDGDREVADGEEAHAASSSGK